MRSSGRDDPHSGAAFATFFSGKKAVNSSAFFDAKAPFSGSFFRMSRAEREQVHTNGLIRSAAGSGAASPGAWSCVNCYAIIHSNQTQEIEPNDPRRTGKTSG